MSFDFHVRLPSEWRSVAEARVGHLAGAVLRPIEGGFVVGFSGTDREMVEVYAAMVELASRSGGTLRNLQSGADVELGAPGRLPAGWVEAPKVAARAYPAVLEGVVAQLLAPLGFGWRDKATVIRRSGDMEQGIYFQQLSGRSAGRVRVQGYWTPLHDGPETGTSMASVFYRAELRCDKPAIAQLSGSLTQALNVHILPWMMRFWSISELVDGYESGALTAPQAFGTRLVEEMAACYRTIHQQARGVEQLRTLGGRLAKHRPAGDDGSFDRYLEAIAREVEEVIVQRLKPDLR